MRLAPSDILVVVRLGNGGFEVYDNAGLMDVVVDEDGFYSGMMQPLTPSAASSSGAALREEWVAVPAAMVTAGG